MRNFSDDFQDDGGTPAWRSRHARVIDVHQPGIASWWRRTPAWKLVLLAAAFGFLGPVSIYVVGIGSVVVYSLVAGY
jgi:hypothetical protein